MRSQLLIALLSLSTLAPSAAFAQTAKPADKPADKPVTAKPADKPKPAPKKADAKKPDAAAPATDAAAGAGAAAAPAPAPVDLAPPPPPPWNSTPAATTSTAGAELMPATPSAPPTVAAGSAEGGEEKTTRENRFRMLEARIEADEKADKENSEKLAWLKKFRLTGFVQPQLLWQGFNTAGSPNLVKGVLPPTATTSNVIGKTDAYGNNITTNTDYFRMRRARLKTEFMPTDYARIIFEIDPTPTGGPASGWGTAARNVEADGIVRWTDDIVTDFGAGIFKLPFGYEVMQSDADRVFIERSWGEQNMTPGEYDTGAKAYTHMRLPRLFGENNSTLDVQLALVNGVTQGEKTFALIPDMNQGKDFVGRLNFNAGDWFDVGVSGYIGTGQEVDPAGTTATHFKQFARNAFLGELGFHHEWSKGWGTRLLAEYTMGQNMDRGVNYGAGVGLPKIPTAIGTDVQSFGERNMWFRVEQDLTEWFTLAIRYDQYTPNISVDTNARDTIGAVAVVHFTKGLEWRNEFWNSRDNVHASGGTPPSKEIDVFSSVFQARF
jgi:hypothetical protein